MKFLAVLALIGFICVVRAATKEELEKRAKDLEARIEKEIQLLRITHPIEAVLLEVEERALKRLAYQLENAILPQTIIVVEEELSRLERAVENRLSRLEGSTGRPTGSPSPRPTGSPSPKPTGSPSPRPTGSPSPRPTGSPSPRPTGSPSPRPTGSPSPRPTGSPSPRPTGSPSPRPTGTPRPRPTGTPGPRPTGTTGGRPTPTGTPEY